MTGDIDRVLIGADRIAETVQRLGQEIARDYQGREPYLVGILKGAVVFLADLARSVPLPLTMDFMAISSYGTSRQSTGIVKITQDLSQNIQGRDVIIVEDIVDTGLTLGYLKDLLHVREPRSLAACTLLNKPSRRKLEVHLDYVGIEIPNEFVVGYGLDYAEKYRNLPDICVLKEQVYANG
ncbi:MAG: hypoxanthine phosphoribosyltransferase [Candidatus Eisenbacteria bacterium]|jgi:hypoxanthine phosphoribosyltransferase|nr:hypoxanthine phosphoribosyltransferase [Candidatus Eisenbacteria bacterium]